MFSVLVPPGRSAISVTYIGFAEQVIDISNLTNVSVTMTEGQLLDEVVVTALGIKRDKKALGYASTTVGADELAAKPETDVARALAGRSPGVHCQFSRFGWFSTKINIRVSKYHFCTASLYGLSMEFHQYFLNENNNFNDGNITPTETLTSIQTTLPA
jgi:hypothetical protein